MAWPIMASAQQYQVDTQTCPNLIVTVTMTKPDSRRYSMSFVESDPAQVNQHAATFVSTYLVPKFNDPTAPSGDSQGYDIFANRLDWIILDQSPLGEGCSD